MGKQAFENETGIKFSDWHGKYWVRWGDAVIEAGYKRNKFNTAFDLNFICEKYAGLTRKLGHIPISGEIRMKAREDKSFPSHTVFSRIGKDQLVQHALEFCDANEGWDDVTAICAQHKPKHIKIESEKTNANPQDGYVYLIKSGRHYKIGMTNDIHRRSREIAIELPERSETIHVIRTDDPSGIEAYWHRRFDDKRTNGEWFNLNPSDVKAFRRRKFM